MVSYFVPDFDMDDDGGIAASAAPDNHKIASQSHEDDDKFRMLELLWQQSPVLRPLEHAAELPPESSYVASTAEASHHHHQLFMKEDEISTWLHPYLESCCRGGGGGDLYSEMMGPSSRASCYSPVGQATHQEEGGAAAAAAPAAAGDAGVAFDAASVRASVGDSSMHTSDKKRKGALRAEDSEDVEVEYGKKRKDTRQPRTRSAEVHNLSERRRRDRINEKMKALQELIPRCNKSDKASMLDDAIEYLKSLQLQVQMMSSMQYTMGQMMFPDAQRYLQTMGFMGMGIRIPSGSMQCPMMPFGSVLPYPTVVGPSPANLRPQLVPPFHMATAVIPDQVRMNASNQQDPLCSSIGMMGPNMTNMVQIPNLADPYHHYAPLHHLQVPSQGQTLPGASMETDNTKRSTG